MLHAINALVLRCSRSLWAVLLIIATFTACLLTMLPLSRDFRAITGFDVFDMQNGLTPSTALAQLQHYTPRARALYRMLSAVDFVFPFAAGLMSASISAFSIRSISPATDARFAERRVYLLFFLGPVFDWTENLCALSLIHAPAGSHQWPLALGLVIAKMLKLLFAFGAQAAMFLLLLAAFVHWLRRRR